MSITMHLHIEVKKDGKWFHYGSPCMSNLPEKYFIYAWMTGEGLEYTRSRFREQIQPVASIKGLPEDLSEVTKICYEQDTKQYRLHGEHTLMADDIQTLQEKLWEQNPDDNRLYWDLEETIFRTYINSGSIACHHGWDDARIICWYNY